MDSGLALVLAATIPSTVTAITTVLLHRNTKAIQREVQTLNESTVGQLAAAGETRRVEHIPEADRTAKEQRHIDSDPEHVEPDDRDPQEWTP